VPADPQRDPARPEDVDRGQAAQPGAVRRLDGQPPALPADAQGGERRPRAEARPVPGGADRRG
jgi:hypothetical protein